MGRRKGPKIMAVTITIPTELEPSLAERALQNGQDIGSYLSRLIATHLQKPSLDELLAPIREDFAKSGMNEEELNDLIERERQALWEEKHANK